MAIVTCEERIRVGPDPDKEKKTNPYVDKFHETANLRPTKCHGKSFKHFTNFTLALNNQRVEIKLTKL